MTNATWVLRPGVLVDRCDPSFVGRPQRAHGSVFDWRQGEHEAKRTDRRENMMQTIMPSDYPECATQPVELFVGRISSGPWAPPARVFTRCRAIRRKPFSLRTAKRRQLVRGDMNPTSLGKRMCPRARCSGELRR